MRNLSLLFTLFSFFSLSAQTRDQSIGFMENRGQVVDQKDRPNPKVRYLLNTNGLNVQLRENGFSYDIYETKKHPLTKSRKKDLGQSSFIKEDTLNYPNYTLEYICHRIDIDFENSNTGARLIAGRKSTDFDNYYTIKGIPDGVTNVYKFQKVTYKNIYNNIDVVFFIPDDKSKPVEYNFIVNPGGRLADIQLRFSGAKTELAGNKIRMDVRFGQMEETLPLSWTENGTDKKEIGIAYKKIRRNVYGFEGSTSPAGKKIVIDPTPVRLWGTYYGGSGNEFAAAINIDSNNNAIVSGATGSSNNIATGGPNTSGYSSGKAFIAKFSPTGQRIWSSYYPFGTGGLKLDQQDNMYLIGKVLDANPSIPSSGCHQPVKDMYTSGYLIKLNSDGAKLWGTYYGGNDNEDLNNLTVDSNGNIYLVGGTSSSDAFATPGALQSTKNSPGSYQTGFIAKFDANGNRIWGTFYGGSLADGFHDCDISSDGYLYAVGTHNSPDNITTPGSFQPTSSKTGGMIVKFDLDGNRIWGTFIADNSYILNGRLKGDNIILSGRAFSNGLGTPGTMSENIINPLPPGSTLSSNQNSVIIKFNVQTQQYIWGTYFIEQIIGLDVDSSDNVFFSGYTGIDNGLATPDGFMPTKSNYLKCYLVKLNPLGQKVWGTYYGGNFAEQLGDVKIDLNNDIYLFGNTNGSTTGIATPGASQTTLASNPDTFLVKFKDCLSSSIAVSNSPVCIGSKIELAASGGTNYLWTGPNGFSSTLPNPTILNATAADAGQYSCNITGSTGGCDGTSTINVVVGDTVKPIPDTTLLSIITGSCNTTVAVPTATDKCAGTITATTTDPLSYSLPGTYTVHWSYDDGNGNIATQEQTVTITAVALPVMASPQIFCVQQNARLASIVLAGQNIRWYDAATGGNLLAPTASLVDGTTYYASQTISGCESLRVPVLINIQNTPTPTGLAAQTFCSLQNATLNDIAVTGSNLAWYDSLSATTTAIPGTTLLVSGKTYYASQAVNGCESINRLAVTVTLTNTLNARDYSETICDDLNDGSEIIDLTDYNGNLVSIASNYTFEYYSSLSGATSQNSAELIAPITRYNLVLGLHSIYIRITSNAGCNQIVRLDLTLAGKPVIVIPDTVPICEKGDVTIDAGIGFDSYLWSTGSTLHAVTLSQPGNYFVTVTSHNGTVACSSTKNFTVVLSKAATITSIETRDWTDTENVIAVNTNPGNYEFSIDGINYQPGNVFQGLQGGLYTVYVHDINGCGITKENIFLLMYPKFFTPNGDGQNDTWGINFSYLEPGLKVIIFDRYGKVLKELVDKDSWDGRYNGYGLPSDDYWFVVTRADGKEYRGHFALKR